MFVLLSENCTRRGKGSQIFPDSDLFLVSFKKVAQHVAKERDAVIGGEVNVTSVPKQILEIQQTQRITGDFLISSLFCLVFVTGNMLHLSILGE